MLASRPSLVRFLDAPPVMRSEIARRVFERTGAETQRRSFVYCREGSRIGISRPLFRSDFRGGQNNFSVTRLQSTVADTTSPQPPSPQPPLESPAAPQPSSLARRFLVTTSLVLLFSLAGLAMAASPAAETVNGFVNPPTDAETLTLYHAPTSTAAQINDHITNHPLAQRLRAQASMIECRPHLKIPPTLREHNFTGGVLLGENKIEVPPLVFNERDAALPTLVSLCYLGDSVCGHPGIVHGGLLATLLDEGLARCCFPALPNKVGMTASLKIDYRSPCPAGKYIVLKAETTKVEGRKAWVKGWIEILGEEDGDGVKVVEAEALFVEPKGASKMPRVYSTS